MTNARFEYCVILWLTQLQKKKLHAERHIWHAERMNRITCSECSRYKHSSYWNIDVLLSFGIAERNTNARVAWCMTNYNSNLPTKSDAIFSPQHCQFSRWINKVIRSRVEHRWLADTTIVPRLNTKSSRTSASISTSLTLRDRREEYECDGELVFAFFEEFERLPLESLSFDVLIVAEERNYDTHEDLVHSYSKHMDNEKANNQYK